MPVATYEHPAWQAVADQAMRPGGLAVTRQALALCELPPGARLLDVGCGAGATLHYLGAECRLARLGVDASLKLLRRARQNDLVLPLAQARGEHLPFAGETIDVLLSECTLSIFDTGQALAEWGRVLKRGGHLMVSDVYVRNPEGVAALRQLPPGSCIREAMPQAQIIEYIERRGLQVTAWQDCSQALKHFAVCTLGTAMAVDPFDLHIAAARARLGYYWLIARKGGR